MDNSDQEVILTDDNGEIFNGRNFGTLRGHQPRPRWHHLRQRAYNGQPSMTQEVHADQTDVNAIVARFERTGHFPAQTGIPRYDDVTGLQGDLTETIERSRATQQTAAEFARNWRPAPPPPEPETVPTPPATPAP